MKGIVKLRTLTINTVYVHKGKKTVVANLNSPVRFNEESHQIR